MSRIEYTSFIQLYEFNANFDPDNSNSETYSRSFPFQNHTIDTSSVIEAHGLLTSLLLENDLPQHVADTLKRVAKILDPSPNTGTSPIVIRLL